MKKTTKTLLIMLGVLLVLGAAAAALLLAPPAAEEESPDSSAPETKVLMETDPADVASITVENSEGGFTLVPVEPEDDDAALVFTLGGYEAQRIDTSSATIAAKSVLSLTSAKELEAQEDLAPFGLSGENAVQVTVTGKDGVKDVLVLGNKGGETSGRYVLKDGAVYIASSPDDRLYGSALALFDKEVYSVAKRTEETTNDKGEAYDATAEDLLYRVKISGKSFATPVEIGYNEKEESCSILSPISGPADESAMSNLTAALRSINAYRVVAANAGQEELAAYGLAEPEAQVEFTMNSETHVLKAAPGENSDSRYLTADDTGVVYLVTAEKISPWEKADPVKLRTSAVLAPEVTSVKKLTLTAEGGQPRVFTAEREKDKEHSTEETPAYTVSAVKNGEGKEILWANYYSFYEMLTKPAVLSAAEAESAALRFAVTYEYFDGGTDTVEFYVSEGVEDRCSVTVNGRFSGLVRQSDVDSLLAPLEKLYAGELVA